MSGGQTEMRIYCIDDKWLVCWLLVLGLTSHLRQYFSLYRAVSQREVERKERNSKQTHLHLL